MPKSIIAYKLARPDGWDFHTGKTINYRSDNFPHTVICPNADEAKGICSSGVIHASVDPNACFVGAKIPCSAYKVKGVPACGDKSKYGFTRLTVLKEITDLDNLFGWRYSESVNPIHPLTGKPKTPTKIDIELVKQWASVWASVRASVGASVEASVGDSVWDSVWDSVRALVGASVRALVGDSVRASVGDSVGASVGASVWDSVGAYIGSLFPNIGQWKYVTHRKGEYPFQPAVDLWKRGFVPSYDGKKWRLHSGAKAKIVWKEK